MESVSTRRRRIVLAAQKNRYEPLIALNHHMDLNWMSEAYRCVRKSAAPGVDGQTVAEYGENLVENLRDLQARAKSGSYKAPDRLIAKWLKAGVWEKGKVSYPDEGTPQGGVICRHFVRERWPAISAALRFTATQ